MRKPKNPNSKSIQSITWYNLPNWIGRTLVADWRKYQHKKRAISIHRLLRMLKPNLKQPIFIIGSGRSGTTFLGSCLGELPEISYHFEPVITKAAARYIYEGQWEFGRAKKFYRDVYGWLMRIHFDADLTFAEKTPRNSFIIPFLHKTFPEARFIHIIRDGRDVANSLLQKPWYRADAGTSGLIEPGGYPYGPYARFWVESERVKEFEATSDIHRCIWLWRCYLEHLMEAISQLPAKQYHELKYEDLVSNPTIEADRILDFLEILAPESRHLFHKAVTKVKSDSVGRWKQELSEEQIKQIELEAGDLLWQLGYIKSNSYWQTLSD